MKVECIMAVFLKHPYLHCISKLLEHIIHIIQLHGNRGFCKSFNNIWLLCYFLKNFFEMFTHRVIGFKKEISDRYN